MTNNTPDVRRAPPRILCVDDEPRVLEALERTLRGKFTVVTAAGAEAALAELKRDAGFAVIMSDLRMPGMDGIALLAAAREHAPDAVRVLLTGHADLEVAIEAVNHGHVFRFLRKPCHPDVMTKALRAAVEQHRLVTAERELLEQTVRGSIRALAEVLALVSPAAFGRVERVQRIVVPLARELAVPDPWSVEVATTIWHLGCVALSPTVADKIGSGIELGPEEAALLVELPEAAAQLVAHIPRLEAVRDLLSAIANGSRGDVPLGAQALRAALDLDTLEARGATTAAAFEVLDVALAGYDPRVLVELRRMRGVEGSAMQVRDMRLRDVTLGMVFASDVLNHAGLLLIARGQEVTMPLLERVRTYWSGSTGSEMVRMIVRRDSSSTAAAGETNGDAGQTATRGLPGDRGMSAPAHCSERPVRETAEAVPAVPSAPSTGRFGWWR